MRHDRTRSEDAGRPHQGCSVHCPPARLKHLVQQAEVSKGTSLLLLLLLVAWRGS